MALSKKDKLLQAAQKNIQKGQWLKAAKEFQKVLELDPKDVRSRQRMAELFNRAGMSAESMQAYEAVAKHYADNGFYLKAIAVFKQMQKIDPSDPKIYQRLAELNEKQGLVGNALGEYRHLAEIYEKSGNVEKLNATLEKMQELDPENAGLRLRLCQNYLTGDASEKTQEVLQETLVALEKIKDPAATGKFRDLLQAHRPDDFSLKTGVARILLLCDQPEEVVALLADDRDQSSERKRILPVLALAYRQMKDFASERQLYELLLADEPDHLDYQEAYARACLDNGDEQQALERLDGWKATFLRDNRAAVLKEFYERLQVTCGDDERVRQSLHEIYENTGEGSKLFDLLSEGDRKPDQSDDSSTGEADASGEWFGDDLLEVQAGEVPAAQELQSPENIADQVDPSVEDPSEADVLPVEEAGLAEVDGQDDLLEEVVPEAEIGDVEDACLAEDASSEADDDEIELDLEFEIELDLGEAESSFEEVPEAGLVEDIEPLEDEVESQDGMDFDALSLDAAVQEGSMSEDAAAGMSSFDDAAGIEPSLPSGSDVVDGASDVDDELADLQRELGEVFEMDSFDLEDDDDEPDLTSDLEEAEFYLQQDFLDEALTKCQVLQERHPKNRDVAALLQQVEERLSRQQAEPVAVVEEAAVETVPDAADKLSDNKEQSRLEGNISAFKKGIEDAVAQDDCETHYELGIAYKEMGLFDEAIEEFKKAMGHPSRFIDALTLTGICLASKGDYDQAAELFKKGLHHEGLEEGDRLNLYFELGQLYLAWGRPLEALDSFEQVADADLSYRDVGSQVRRLREELGLDDDRDPGGPAGGSGSNRVSYL